MKILPIALSTLLFLSGTANAASLFDGTTLGAGYANDQVRGETFNGYSVNSQAHLVTVDKVNVFSDFRISDTSSANLQQSADLERYQANIGVEMPYKVTQSITLRPYATTGWSWDKMTQADQDTHDNSFMGSVGIKTQFGEHFVTNVGYSKETSAMKAGQFMVDAGYRF